MRSWHRNDEYLEEKGHATDLITDEAVRVIESHHEKPFFLYVTYSVPHYPLDEPERWTAMYEGTIADPSRRWLAASITHMDHGIGQLVAALDRKHLRENTLIVFVSDNGGQKSWHSGTQYQGRYADKPHMVLGDNKPLRGWKGDVYEGGIRVPALANWSGTLAPGRCDVPIHIVDWMPTLCALAGAPPARDLNWDGADVWSCVRGAACTERSLYWKAPKFSAVRSGDWKVVIKNDGSGAELYDLAADPYETKDLASQHSKRLAKLKRLWADFAAGDR